MRPTIHGPQSPARGARRIPERVSDQELPIGFQDAGRLNQNLIQLLVGEMVSHGVAGQKVHRARANRHPSRIRQDSTSVMRGGESPEFGHLDVETDVRAVRGQELCYDSRAAAQIEDQTRTGLIKLAPLRPGQRTSGEDRTEIITPPGGSYAVEQIQAALSDHADVTFASNRQFRINLGPSDTSAAPEAGNSRPNW